MFVKCLKMAAFTLAQDDSLSHFLAYVLFLPNYQTKRLFCVCDKMHTYCNLRMCQHV